MSLHHAPADGPTRHVLVVDDDEAFAARLAHDLEASGFRVTLTSRCDDALRCANAVHIDAAVLAHRLPDGDALMLLGLSDRFKSTPTLVLTGAPDMAFAVKCMRAGAADVLARPLTSTELLAALDDALARCSMTIPIAAPTGEGRILAGSSAAICRLREDVTELIGEESSVLLLGETGTGKSLLARYIHAQGPRASKPFVALNCATMSRELVSSELFGHERGAFTGALTSKPGLLEAANGGTLLLDEIGDLDVVVQAKLLTVLDEGSFRRVGGIKELRTDIRLITATHVDLARAVAERTFREDLYYRISATTLVVPPLRERGADILGLARAVIAELAARRGRNPPVLTSAAEAALLAYPWPGNVRELRALFERALAHTIGSTLDVDALRFSAQAKPAPPAPTRTLRAVERQHIEEALYAAGGRVDHAAHALGMPRSTLYLRLKQYGITPSDFARRA